MTADAPPDAALVDPLSINCPTCTAIAGEPCKVRKPAGTYRSPDHFQSLSIPGFHRTRIDPERRLRERGAQIRERLAWIAEAGIWTVMDLLTLVREAEPNDVELAIIADLMIGTGRSRGGWCDGQPPCSPTHCHYSYGEHPPRRTDPYSPW